MKNYLGMRSLHTVMGSEIFVNVSFDHETVMGLVSEKIQARVNSTRNA